MKNTFAICTALVVVLGSLASPAFAKHRTTATQDTPYYAQGTHEQYVTHPADVVTFGNRVIGEDPDPAIRAQMQHDPMPSEY